MNQVLLVEDDQSLAESLVQYFPLHGIQPTHARNLKEAREKISKETEVVILDWGLPDGQGLDYLVELRKAAHLVPVIMLTARTEVVDRVLGLESGADDYVLKPFEPRELVARIRSQLRGKVDAVEVLDSLPSILTYRDVQVDLDQRKVLHGEKDVILTKLEFNLLKFFIENPKKAISRDELLNQVWGFEAFPTTRTVDMHVLQLRNKINQSYFETVRGFGYRLA